MAAPHPFCSRTESEFNLLWAENNPALFVSRIQEFQKDHPVTHWRHHVDLGRNGFITLIAVKRDTPFDTVQDYLKAGRLDGELFLSEIGMAR